MKRENKKKFTILILTIVIFFVGFFVYYKNKDIIISIETSDKGASSENGLAPLKEIRGEQNKKNSLKENIGIK